MRTITIIVCLFFMLAGVASAEPVTFLAMDTAMTLSAPGADAALMEKCVARVRELEGLFSVTNPESEISRLNREGCAALSEDSLEITDFALKMCADTGGALNIAMYPVARLWGFTTGEYRVPGDAEIAALLENTDYRAIALEDGTARAPEGVMIDLGSVAKGYASDALAEILRENGVETALLDLGGNIYCLGAKADGSPWRVGIRSPIGEGYCGALEVVDSAVVTSGNYERYFEMDGVRYGHIFDPETGRPAESGMLSVTVTAESGALCDALSTALYVMGPERAAEYLRGRDDVEAVLATEDGRLVITQGLRERFSPMGDFEKWDVEWIER